MSCAGAAYITEIILGVMNRCVVEREGLCSVGEGGVGREACS